MRGEIPMRGEIEPPGDLSLLDVQVTIFYPSSTSVSSHMFADPMMFHV